MRCEDRSGCNAPERLVEVDGILLHLLPGELQDREGAVSLVEMQDARLDADGVEGADAAHTEEQLLPDPHGGVPAVEPARQSAIVRTV